jgi:hypothetical protein
MDVKVIKPRIIGNQNSFAPLHFVSLKVPIKEVPNKNINEPQSASIGLCQILTK